MNTMKAGFVHLPMLPDPEAGIPGVPLEATARAVRLCVEAVL